jgi:4-hydroxybenzoate polyprenyltransferase
MKYLKLIRYQNLLLLAFMQLIFRFGFLKLQNIYLSLTDWQYGLLVLATVFLAAGGYVINDIFDQDTDNDNKPNKVIIGKSISEVKGYNIYITLNITGVGIGFYLSNVIQKPSFAVIFILIAATLYFYATSLKQMILVGNFIVALLLALSVIIIGIFDLFPATYDGNQAIMSVMFKILLDYAIFAFIINFIREIVKDMEDVNGDYNQGMNTLPIAIGVRRTGKITFGLIAIAMLILLYYVNENLMVFNLYFATVYAIVFVLSPLLFCLIKMWSAKSKKDFHLISTVLKLVIFFGILSIVIINLNIMNNA